MSMMRPLPFDEGRTWFSADIHDERGKSSDRSKDPPPSSDGHLHFSSASCCTIGVIGSSFFEINSRSYIFMTSVDICILLMLVTRM